MFSCEFSEICKNTFSGRTPPVAASVGNGLIFVLGFYCRANELSNDSQIALIINLAKYFDEIFYFSYKAVRIP